jgi:hypothetical protein
MTTKFYSLIKEFLPLPETENNKQNPNFIVVTRNGNFVSLYSQTPNTNYKEISLKDELHTDPDDPAWKEYENLMNNNSKYSQVKNIEGN